MNKQIVLAFLLVISVFLLYRCAEDDNFSCDNGICSG